MLLAEERKWFYWRKWEGFGCFSLVRRVGVYERIWWLIERSRVGYDRITCSIERSRIKYDRITCLIERPRVEYEQIVCLGVRALSMIGYDV